MIGDILRATSHSGIVYSVGGDGSLYFAEAWGGKKPHQDRRTVRGHIHQR